MRQIDEMSGEQIEILKLKGMLPMNNQTKPVTGEGNAPRNQIKLSEVNKLEKRMGARVWDGVLYNRDGITNPTLTILNNKVGREIQAVLALKA